MASRQCVQGAGTGLARLRSVAAQGLVVRHGGAASCASDVQALVTGIDVAQRARVGVLVEHVVPRRGGAPGQSRSGARRWMLLPATAPTAGAAPPGAQNLDQGSFAPALPQTPAALKLMARVPASSCAARRYVHRHRPARHGGFCDAQSIAHPWCASGLAAARVGSQALRQPAVTLMPGDTPSRSVSASPGA